MGSTSEGLPLYRQVALLGRFGGGDLSRNTLAASIVCVGQAVQPIINLLREHSPDAPLTYGDETVPVRPQQSHESWWLLAIDNNELSLVS